MASEAYKKDSRGETVKQIQKKVGVTADGIFGQKTEEAVKKWQAEHNLTADGFVGIKTLSAMGIFKDENETQETGFVLHQHYLKKGE